jgi:hypothetical protein
MPKYSGNQILQNGLYGAVSPTALNYRKTAESSNFGTRKLAFYSVYLNQDFNMAANYAENNSLYYQIVRAIQQGAPGIGGIYTPSYIGDGTIQTGGGGGAELFYVGLPQNSATSPLNQQDNWYGIKPIHGTDLFSVVSASGTGTIATLIFATDTGTPPFNVGDAVEVQNVGSGYDCLLIDQHFVTECTTTYVRYNSTATATLTGLVDASIYADLGYDCFTFAVVDDAEPFPQGADDGNTDYSGVAGDQEYYCDTGNWYTAIFPYNFAEAVAQVLQDNDLPQEPGLDFQIWRLKNSFGILPV